MRAKEFVAATLVYHSGYKIEFDCEIIYKALVKYLMTQACLKREHTQKYKYAHVHVVVGWSMKEKQGKTKNL